MIMDLSGKWELTLKNKTSQITLPDSLSNAGFGEINDNRETGYLTEKYKYTGTAFFSREIELEEIVDKQVFLFLERTRISTVYFDDKKLDTLDSLVAPHIHKLPSSISAGSHKLTIEVSNEGYKTGGGHMTSPDTQTNWLGILGEIKLIVHEKQYIERLFIKTENIHNALDDIVDNAAEIFVKVYLNDTCENLFKNLFISEITLNKKSGENDFLYKITDGIKYIETENAYELSIIISGEKIFWDEYERNLFELNVVLNNGEAYKDSFGIRSLSHEGRKLILNNHQIYLRGKHDGMIWPLTGYAPMDKESWVKRFRVAKEYGINHYRFHTCCPPEAAFQAADEEGIYLESEIPFWGTVNAPNEEGYNKVEQDFLWTEGYRMLDTFGNHPSFVMFSLGNELWGNKEYINSKLSEYKSYDDRFWYLGGSNSFQFDNYIMPSEDIYSNVRFSRDRLFRGSYAMCDAPLGFVQDRKPCSDYTYDSIFEGEIGGDIRAKQFCDKQCEDSDILAKQAPDVAGENNNENIDGYIDIQYGTGTKKVKVSNDVNILVPRVPVISHEIGQYYCFPNINEKEKYVGVLEARYLDIYKERAIDNKVFDMWPVFKDASGALSVASYKQEIEAALMTENLSGFQLLDLQDFNGQNVALVGILDAFMESKGLISSEKWRGFCSDHVVMAQFPKFVFENGEDINIPIVASIADYHRTKNIKVEYELFEDGQKICADKYELNDIEKRVNEVARISISELLTNSNDSFVNDFEKPKEYKLKLYIYNNKKGNILEAIKATIPDSVNEYEFYVFPKISDEEILINENEIIDKKYDRRVIITKTVEEAIRLKQQGQNVICIPENTAAGKTGDYTDSIPGYYAPEFWNYKMFKDISVQNNKPEPYGTLGLAIDCNDYIFENFPTRFYSTPIWYNFVSHSFAKDLKYENFTDNDRVLVQTIDNPERSKRLGMLYYKDNILVCNSKLWEIKEEPEIKSLVRSILKEIFLI